MAGGSAISTQMGRVGVPAVSTRGPYWFYVGSLINEDGCDQVLGVDRHGSSIHLTPHRQGRPLKHNTEHHPDQQSEAYAKR